MKKFLTTLSKKLLLLGIAVGMSALFSTTAFAANKVVDFSTITSQTFALNQAATAVTPTIIITDDGTTATITAANDIKLRIPAGATNVVWDATDTSITINDAGAMVKITKAAGGACVAGAACTVTVTYADANKTMIIPVETNFAATDSIQITTLTTTMSTFTAEFDNIGLGISTDADNTEDTNCGTGAQACNTQTIVSGENIDVGAVTIASAAAQKFAQNQAAVAISAITITEDAVSPVLNSTDDIRITIPSGSNFIWDSADTTLILTDGNGTPLADTGKVTSCTASPCTVTLSATNFENSGRTLFIPLAGAFAAADAFVISGINYKTFSARSAGTDNLDLDVAPASTVVNVDTAAISVSTPTILSSAAQQFTTGMNTQPLDWTITVTEDASVVIINATDNLRIKIPSTFNMNFDPSDTSITAGGTGVVAVGVSAAGIACGAAPCTVTLVASDYKQADGTTACTAAAGDCRTLIVPIVAAPTVGQTITITGASLFNFSSASTADNLELEVVAATIYGTAAVDEDNVTMTVVVGTTRDRTGPSAPTGVSVTDQGVLTWTDPTNSDLKEIEVLKGVGNDPVSGTPIAIVAKGIKTYTDTGVQVGQTVSYILRAKDTANNYSANTATVTVVIAAAAIEETTEDEAVDDTTVDETTGDEATGDDEMADDATDETTGDDMTDADDAADDDMADEEDSDEEMIEVGADLSGHWSEPVFTTMIRYGIVEGDAGTGNVRPDGYLNRAEAGTLLYRVLGLGEPSAPSTAPFSDVIKTHWSAGYIAYLKSLELVTGNPNGTYGPANNINRAEFVTLAMRVCYYVSCEAQEEIDDLRAGSKTDAYRDLADGWYTANVTAATELGFVSGRTCTGGKCFDANSNITRAEATAILYRMFNTYLEER